MAQGDGFLYNAFLVDVISGVHDFANDSLVVSLHTGYTPDVDTDAVWADISATEYGTGDGYTAGGEVLQNVVVTQNDTDDRAEVDADNPVWTALGPLTPATPSHATLRNDTAAGDPLIGFWELGATATNGEDYELVFSASGFFHLAPA